jgi:hypothetical protein
MRRLCALVALSAACSEIGPRPPVPRIAIDPEFIPEHDAHRTPVTLDGSESADELEDESAPLTFRWEVDDPSGRAVEGALDAPLVVMTFAGERVVRVTLTVTDPQGMSASITERVGLTIE